MNRRSLVGAAAMLPILPARLRAAPFARVRPSDAAWPQQASWDALRARLRGRLFAPISPLEGCAGEPAACSRIFEAMRNPYFLADEPALTQTLGWVGAWTSQPSRYVAEVESARDVAAVVDFCRERHLRLVVKGGGHSYLGTSNAPDSVLVWTRHLDRVALHDSFVPAGCAGTVEPAPAVSVGAGSRWGSVYDAVTTGAGRYVQGGGCLTVGVAGLIQSGGFGSFSKRHGLAAASLLEAEIVTADGSIRIVNACRDPDLFWALKGGGGGTFGIVTRLTLRTHDLPATFGGLFGRVRAKSDAAFRRLIDRFLAFYAEALFGPIWGEQVSVRPGNILHLAMVCYGLDQIAAEEAWRPFLRWLEQEERHYEIVSPVQVLIAPARRFWDPAFLRGIPGLVLGDTRPGASARDVFWAGNLNEAGQVLHGYRSAWISHAFLRPTGREALADALFAASRHWNVSLHLNKGLAGAPAPVLQGARETAINPLAIDAFALAIVASEGPPAYPGIPGHEPDVVLARRRKEAIGRAFDALGPVLPRRGSYLAEADFFDESWQDASWGEHYARLLEVKRSYDLDGLFVVHHGVGSEAWSADGFSRRP